MKIFQTTEKNCALIGITAHQSAQKHPFNARNSLVLFILCITLFSNIMRLIRETNNFTDYTISIFSACTMAVSILIFAILLVRLRYLFYFQQHTEEIINQSKSKKKIQELFTHSNWISEIFISGFGFPSSKAIYEKANPKVEKWSAFIVFMVMKVLLQCVMFSQFFVSYILYFEMDMGPESFELPFPFWWVSDVHDGKIIWSEVKSIFTLLYVFGRFPFDYRNPIGYLFAFFLQYIALLNLFFYVCCMACIGIGFFMFIISITKDIKNNLRSINEHLKKSMSEHEKSEISTQFLDTIQFHAVAKQLSWIFLSSSSFYWLCFFKSWYFHS